jgi:hypothetical protein
MSEAPERSPVFRRWSHWYAVVIAVLILVIVCLSIFSSAYQ